MTEEPANEPIPLSDMLVTLQREISRVQDESALVAPGESRALITDDLNFTVKFRFTPVAASEDDVPEDEQTIDSILVDEAGAHEMTLTGKIAPNVPVIEFPAEVVRAEVIEE